MTKILDLLTFVIVLPAALGSAIYLWRYDELCGSIWEKRLTIVNAISSLIVLMRMLLEHL